MKVESTSTRHRRCLLPRWWWRTRRWRRLWWWTQTAAQCRATSRQQPAMSGERSECSCSAALLPLRRHQSRSLCVLVSSIRSRSTSTSNVAATSVGFQPHCLSSTSTGATRSLKKPRLSSPMARRWLPGDWRRTRLWCTATLGPRPSPSCWATPSPAHRRSPIRPPRAQAADECWRCGRSEHGRGWGATVERAQLRTMATFSHARGLSR
mmetsp:Transcript_17282/g.55477  ORF Transcript_17282/g.55477 Transcript_17282/m.55477 type:complete len:209 (-) Transcript_17282:369-995(-)